MSSQDRTLGSSNPWDPTHASLWDLGAAFRTQFQLPIRAEESQPMTRAADLLFVAEFEAAMRHHAQLSTARRKAKQLTLLAGTDDLVSDALLDRAETLCLRLSDALAVWTANGVASSPHLVNELSNLPCLEAPWDSQQALRQAVDILHVAHATNRQPCSQDDGRLAEDMNKALAFYQRCVGSEERIQERER